MSEQEAEEYRPPRYTIKKLFGKGMTTWDTGGLRPEPLQSEEVREFIEYYVGRYGLEAEDARALIRACLRELGPEREAVAHAADLERGDGRCLVSHAESLEGVLPEEGDGE